MNSPEILFIVPCDFVRQEITGKFIAIGVYTEGVALSQVPGTLSLSFMFWMNLASVGQYRVDIEAFWDGDIAPIQKFGFNFEGNAVSERTCMPIGPVFFPASRGGTLVLKEINLNRDVLRLRVNGPSGSSPPLPELGFLGSGSHPT
jgi:hypothetical protein